MYNTLTALLAVTNTLALAEIVGTGGTLINLLKIMQFFFIKMLRFNSRFFIRRFGIFVDNTATPSIKKAEPVSSVVLEDEIPGFREPGTIPTNYEIAVGVERYEYLKRLRGEDPWEYDQPISISKLGTVKEPIVVKGVDSEFYTACTG